MKKTIANKINILSREFSTQTVLMHEAIARKTGLAGTDHKYIDILLEHGSMTAGRLAQLSGLTTGAATGMIDRLERNNLVKRERDPEDRRKVLVVLDKEQAFQRIGPAFMQMQNDLEKLYDNFSETDLLSVEKYLKAVNEFTRKQIQKLNE